MGGSGAGWGGGCPVPAGVFPPFTPFVCGKVRRGGGRPREVALAGKFVEKSQSVGALGVDPCPVGRISAS